MPAPRRALVAIALAALVSTAAGCMHAPWNPYGGWRVVRSKHITLYTDTYFLHRTTLESLELAYAALANSLFKARPIAPVEVLFLEDPQMLSTFGRYRGRAAVARLPGSGMLGRRGLVVVKEDTFLSGAAHAMAHLFLHAMAPRAPLWVHEAYASYVETIEYRAGGGQQVACLGHLSGSEPLIPLEDLFNWSWDAYDDSKKTDWYRFTARSLIDYFLTGEGGTNVDRFAEWMASVARGRDTRQAYDELFPEMSIAQLELKMVNHRRLSEGRPRGLCPVSFPIPPDRAADTGKPRVDRVEKEDIERLFLRLWLLPRRAGYVDWFPPGVGRLRGPEAGAVKP